MIRTEAGIAIDNVLIYGKAGGAAGGFNFTFNEPPFVVGNASGTLGGLLLGGGFEYALSPVWSAKVEYNYTDYIRRQFAFSNSTPPMDYWSFGVCSQSWNQLQIQLGFAIIYTTRTTIEALIT
jgi:opacity protein-like surface antigen